MFDVHPQRYNIRMYMYVERNNRGDNCVIITIDRRSPGWSVGGWNAFFFGHRPLHLFLFVRYNRTDRSNCYSTSE